MSDPTKVSKGTFVGAVFGSFGRDVRDLFRHPLAVIGGIFGLLLFNALVGGYLMGEVPTYVTFILATLVLIAFVVFLVKLGRSNPKAVLGGLGGTAIISALFVIFAFTSGDANADDPEIEMEFVPGALAKLGERIDEKEVPEKIVTQETRQEEETAQETVTEDEQVKPKEEKPPEKKKAEKKPEKPPITKKDSKLPTSKTPTTKNTPYNDLPTVDHNIGDPFGDPGGWAERAEAGDPWATAIMKALNNMPVGAYAAKAKDGDFKFELTICKDGRVERINRKGGSLPPDMQRSVELELERLKFPKPPADVAKAMPSNCAKIRYTFVWSARGVK